MNNDLRFYLLTGALGVLNDLKDLNSTVDSIDRAGQESALYKDRITRGRLAHFSVAAQKNLEKNLISAIMNIDSGLRKDRRGRPSLTLLRNRVKRFKKQENSNGEDDGRSTE